MSGPIVQGWQCPLCKKIYSPFIPSCNCTEAQEQSTAHWEVWDGWSGNHDQRIEDATCSNCGYKHQTVYSSLKKLSIVCPKCDLRMTDNETK